MHFFQFAAAWLFPCAVCAALATTGVAATDGASTVEHDSSSSPAFGAGGVKAGADPGSSPSASSTTSSSTSSLLGTRSPEKQEGGGAATPRGDAVRRCLRRLARRLQRAGAVDVERPDGRRGRKKGRSTKPDRRGTGVVDGTAREREQAVASAIAYCKESTSRWRSGTSPPPPSPSLDGWLLDRPDQEIGTACAGAAARCKFPVLRRDVSLLEWLPEAPPACTSSDAVPHQRGCTACDESGHESAAETGKRAPRRGPAGELGTCDIFDGLDIDVLRITNYFEYVQCNVEEPLN